MSGNHSRRLVAVEVGSADTNTGGGEHVVQPPLQVAAACSASGTQVVLTYLFAQCTAHSAQQAGEIASDKARRCQKSAGASPKPYQGRSKHVAAAGKAAAKEGVAFCDAEWLAILRQKKQ